jgi:6-phosphofructokinase 1
MMRIAVLTSGGDAPGMNACIRAVVRKGLCEGIEVIGVRRGFEGLISGNLVVMKSRSVGDILHRGGTILKSARSEEFKTEEGRAEALRQIEINKIDAVIGIGGDGTYRGLASLATLGVPTIGIPATIDNDIGSTEYSIGFDTVCNTVVDAVNKIRDTASSHERVYVVEVMGRNSGHIAIASGLACGAQSILTPEIECTIEEVCARVKDGARQGKTHSIILVAEGANSLAKQLCPEVAPEQKTYLIGQEIRRRTGFDTRVIMLGHIQRGGSPSAADRILASRFGARAVELLIVGQPASAVLGLFNGTIRDIAFDEALMMKQSCAVEYYELADILSSI